jgi:hypothetical protein
MPIVAMVAIDLLDMAVLRLTLAPSQHYSPVGQEHGRTIPLPDINLFSGSSVFAELTLRRQAVVRLIFSSVWDVWHSLGEPQHC